MKTVPRGRLGTKTDGQTLKHIQEAIISLKDEYNKNKIAVGLNLQALGTISPIKEQIFDNYCAKKQWLNIAPTLAQQLLLVD